MVHSRFITFNYDNINKQYNVTFFDEDGFFEKIISEETKEQSYDQILQLANYRSSIIIVDYTSINFIAYAREKNKLNLFYKRKREFLSLKTDMIGIMPTQQNTDKALSDVNYLEIKNAEHTLRDFIELDKEEYFSSIWIRNYINIKIALQDIDNERGTGRTTRLVDEFIQQLFVKGKITVRDHHNSRESNEMLFDKIRSRLEYEHCHIVKLYNINKLTIEI